MGPTKFSSKLERWPINYNYLHPPSISCLSFEERCLTPSGSPTLATKAVWRLGVLVYSCYCSSCLRSPFRRCESFDSLVYLPVKTLSNHSLLYRTNFLNFTLRTRWNPGGGGVIVRPPIKVYNRRSRVRPISCGLGPDSCAPTSVNEVV